MRKYALILLAIALTASSAALFADDAADAKQAESSFAKAFADRDAAKFASFIADDAKFFGRNKLLAGRTAVMATWSGYLKDPKAPFSWHPERVETNASGDIAFSTGPVLDPDGKHIADYMSVWQKQKDGSWKIIFDGPGSPVCPPPDKK